MCVGGTSSTYRTSRDISGRYFAVTHGRRVQLWDAPGHSQDFAPFSLYGTLPGQYDDALCLDWSDDSK